MSDPGEAVATFVFLIALIGAGVVGFVVWKLFL
jgi:hypothetical protein